MIGVSSLRLEGFKSIRRMDEALTLSPLNVLVGSNGAGKSNLLSFFRLLNRAMEERLALFVRQQGGANAILYRGRKVTKDIHATMRFETSSGDTNSYTFQLTAVAPDDLIFAEESVAFEPLDPQKRAKQTTLGGGHRESKLHEAVDAGDKTAQTVKWNVDRWRFFHFHDTSPEAPIKQPAQLKDNRFLRSDGANLPAFLYLLKTNYPASYARIRETVRHVAPYFDDFVLEPGIDNPNYIGLEWRERRSDYPFFAHQLSDGTLRFVALATLLLAPELPTSPLTAVIDEPELGLHPSAISALGALLRAASRRMQLIVATQSLALLDEIGDAGSVIVVERFDDQSTFQHGTI